MRRGPWVGKELEGECRPTGGLGAQKEVTTALQPLTLLKDLLLVTLRKDPAAKVPKIDTPLHEATQWRACVGVSRGGEIWGLSAPRGQEGEGSPVSDRVTSSPSCLTCTPPAVWDWGSGEGRNESGGGTFLALPCRLSPGVVRQPGSERYLEHTPGNQLQLRQSLYLACRQTQLNSSIPHVYVRVLGRGTASSHP